MSKIILYAFLFIALAVMFQNENNSQNKIRTTGTMSKTETRTMLDTVGFASKSGQMENVIKLINEQQGELLNKCREENNRTIPWKAVISPHDDYAYVGYLYPALIADVKASTVLLFGVCHKAAQFGMENKIIFDSFKQWKMANGMVPVSPLREELIEELPKELYVINDSVQSAEHSVEAIVPWLKHFNKNVLIISVLVPYMNFDRMKDIAKPMSEAIKKVIKKNKLAWGRDFAIVISSDAVHYGYSAWGGKDYAFCGTGKTGYKKALEHEHEIINNCLTKEISPEKIKQFTNYTVKKEDYKEYKWTWCGRYSIPFGLLTAYYLGELTGNKLNGKLIKYSTSIENVPLNVKPLGMGTTAPASLSHWVGYAAIGYK
jgi:AmmeMemoRadiSam system protein B